MKFPGRRKSKHYFPVSEKERTSLDFKDNNSNRHNYIVGLEQLLVDIEISVDDEFLKSHNFQKGQSFIIDDELAEKLYWEFKEQSRISGEYPGGAVGNTLHNFCTLSGGMAVALGTIKRNIEVGDYAYRYLCKTSSRVDLSHLQPCDKPMGRALCFITPDSERTFAISKGCMNDLEDKYIPEHIIEKASALLISAYTLRDELTPIYKATLKAVNLAKKYNVPVVFSLGTSQLVEAKKEFFLQFIKDYVSVVAMNKAECMALINKEDSLLCAEELLNYTDLVLITVGKRGLYLAGYCDEKFLRHTKDPLHTKSIVDYNKFEYSRGMRRVDCEKPIKIYTHINPFMGGPVSIRNTNGAGDAALSALLHDIAANDFHRDQIPNSPKHNAKYLTYSSLSQVSKYANRVSFEVLIQNSPRLIKGLPEREDSLEEAYWSH
jgi:inosine kinase